MFSTLSERFNFRLPLEGFFESVSILTDLSSRPELLPILDTTEKSAVLTYIDLFSLLTD